MIYLKGREDVLQIDLDATGQPSVMHLGDVGELQFDIEGSTLTVEYVAPDGSISAESFVLTGESDSVEAMPNPSGSVAAAGMRVAHFDASVDNHRAVFVHVSISSPDARLPAYLPAPFLRIGGCHTTRGGGTFGCNRVPAQIIESDGFLCAIGWR